MKATLRVNSIKSSSKDNGICAVPCFKEELVTEIKGWLPDDSEIRRLATLHGALADPSRLKILLALSRGELCVCDVSHVVGLSISATSHQLRLLRNLNLVSYRNDGKMAYYTLTSDAFVISWIKQALERKRWLSANKEK